MNLTLLGARTLMCLVLAVSAVSSFADTIYNNLSPGNVTNSTAQYCLGAGGCATSYWVDAIAFTASSTATLSDIGVALAYVSGQNSATIELLSGSGGLPGSLIESWTVTGLPSWDFSSATHTTPATFVTSGTNPTLNAGQQYWVAVIAGTPNVHDDLLFWVASQPTVYDPFATSQDGGPYNLVPRPYAGDGAFRVDGTPIPEPSSLMMLGSGALGLLGVVRRKRLV